ncbi:hypothetical protein RDV64_00790 [Acuticoccus sp. MNP-M23]|uniref:hypothetical protein n=1 Tax=Acuticoccus sp. MNP-M23 TaxID=3072793 RepID=UPI0028164262|nr:hypothetical protein [Acuticoccus sp. MNP-M23]WMS42970.1 hypothetical protein RDV64_00790 [Acuticoccus sp. MNP-M23]
MARQQHGSRTAGRVRRAGVVCAMVVLPAVLAACSGSSGDKGTFGKIINAGRPEPEVIDPALFTPKSTCPPVNILSGTEVIRRDGGSDDPSRLRWQATITKMARECSPAADGVTVRVGVSGRVIEGGGGAPSAIELPLRIAVRENGEVTYSRLHSVGVTRSGASDDWAYVDEAIAVKDPANAEIVVGFDG